MLQETIFSVFNLKSILFQGLRLNEIFENLFLIKKKSLHQTLENLLSIKKNPFTKLLKIFGQKRKNRSNKPLGNLLSIKKK